MDCETSLLILPKMFAKQKRFFNVIMNDYESFYPKVVFGKEDHPRVF